MFVAGLQSMWNKFKGFVVDGFLVAIAELKKAMPDVLGGTDEEIDKQLQESIAARREARQQAMDEALKDVNDPNAKLQEMVDAQAKKRGDGAGGMKGQQRDFREYLPKVTDRVKGLFQAPDLNRALSYGDNVNVDRATIQTAKNTGVIANEIKRLEPATFK